MEFRRAYPAVPRASAAPAELVRLHPAIGTTRRGSPGRHGAARFVTALAVRLEELRRELVPRAAGRDL